MARYRRHPSPRSRRQPPAAATAPPAGLPPTPPRQPWLPQFRLGTLLVAMVLTSLLFALVGVVVRSGGDLEAHPTLGMLVIGASVAMPIFVMIVAALARPLARWFDSRRASRDSP